MKFHFASMEIGMSKSLTIERLDVYNPKFLLGSFHYLNKMSEKDLIIYFNYVNSKKCESFILDSGAFSMIMLEKKGKQQNIDLEKYINEYIAFIKKWNVKQYIELDVDSIVGYEKGFNPYSNGSSFFIKPCLNVVPSPFKFQSLF